jgi:hypothetical protein
MAVMAVGRSVMVVTVRVVMGSVVGAVMGSMVMIMVAVRIMGWRSEMLAM